MTPATNTQAIPNLPPLPSIPPSQYREALKIAGQYAKEADRYQNVSLVITGHSLGGGLAQYAAMKTGLRGVVFNAAALGSDTFHDIVPQLRNTASRQILNIHMRGDPVHEPTRSILSSRQPGMNYVIDPAPGLPGILPIDVPLLSPAMVKEQRLMAGNREDRSLARCDNSCSDAALSGSAGRLPFSP